MLRGLLRIFVPRGTPRVLLVCECLQCRHLSAPSPQPPETRLLSAIHWFVLTTSVVLPGAQRLLGTVQDAESTPRHTVPGVQAFAGTPALITAALLRSGCAPHPPASQPQPVCPGYCPGAEPGVFLTLQPDPSFSALLCPGPGQPGAPLPVHSARALQLGSFFLEEYLQTA